MLITRSITFLLTGRFFLFVRSAQSNISDTVLDKCVGDDVILRCALNITQPYWYGPEIPEVPLAHHQDHTLNPYSTPVKEGRLSYNENQKDIQIKKLKKSDSGRYFCLVLSVGKHNIILNVIEPPTMSQRILSENVRLHKHEGDNAILECPGEVENPKWFGPKQTCLPVNPKSNQNIVNERRASFTSNNRDLQLSNIQKDDRGYYTCYISPTEMQSSYLYVNEAMAASGSMGAMKSGLTEWQLLRLIVCWLLLLV